MTFIAIDLGTSFIKGAVLDLDTMKLEHIERVPFPRPISGLGSLFREFDPQQILLATHELLKRLLPQASK
jgi:sugar (pentulose or hexulose) kinase